MEFSLIDQWYDEAITDLTSQIDVSKEQTYTINFRSEHANSKIIRDFVGAIFDAFHVNHPWRGRFILITDELINNSIEHGSNADDINQCIITAGFCNKNRDFHIVVEVHDTGKKEKNSISDIKALREKFAKKPDKPVYMQKRGRGLFKITEKIVDRLSFSQSHKWGLAVKIEKHIILPNNNSNTTIA